jgi:hypothetical protein
MARAGRWTSVEDSKLKNAVQKHGDKNWNEITAQVPGRTNQQCRNRWRDVLDPSIGRASGRKGKWTSVEDSKLQDAVQTHGGKDWVAISALVPGRTRNQCAHRWHDALKQRIDQTNGRAGKWTAVEDNKLKDVVQKHGGNDWAAIAALVPGRTKSQCKSRWHAVLDPSIDRANERIKWSEDEDIKLKDAVETHGGKNWGAITAQVPGRTNQQCRSRWFTLRSKA